MEYVTVEEFQKLVIRVDDMETKLPEHDTKIHSLEDSVKDIRNDLTNGFSEINASMTKIDRRFETLDSKFSEALDTTRANVNANITRALDRFDQTRDELRDTTRDHTRQFEELTAKMDSLASNVSQSVDRLTVLERKPADEALELQKNIKSRVVDLAWKILILLLAAGAVAYNVFSAAPLN